MRIRREPSSESISVAFEQAGLRDSMMQRDRDSNNIRVLVPREAAMGEERNENKARSRESHQTTFTDMMDRADLAGLRKGEPFLPAGYIGSPPRKLKTTEV